MANQSNYPEKLTSLNNQRPSRLTSFEDSVLKKSNKTVLFGTTELDHIELWMYNPDGTFAAVANIPATDPSINALSIIDTSGAYEFINLNLQKIANTWGISSGRYSFTANFFRTEVGSDSTYQLYVTDISEDRTEVKISSLEPTDQIKKDIYEFVTPSVPRQPATALIQQTFGRAELSTTAPGESITYTDILNTINSITDLFVERLVYANLQAEFKIFYDAFVERVFARTVDNLVSDAKNYQIQQQELNQYVIDAMFFTINEMQQSGQIDSRFEVI